MAKLQPTVQLNFRLDPALSDALAEHCRASGEKKTDVIDRALRKELNLPLASTDTKD